MIDATLGQTLGMEKLLYRREKNICHRIMVLLPHRVIMLHFRYEVMASLAARNGATKVQSTIRFSPCFFMIQ